jgi:hypothetical protein
MKIKELSILTNNEIKEVLLGWLSSYESFQENLLKNHHDTLIPLTTEGVDLLHDTDYVGARACFLSNEIAYNAVSKKIRDEIDIIVDFIKSDDREIHLECKSDVDVAQVVFAGKQKRIARTL